MNLSGPGSIDLLARALSAEFPELDRERVRAAVQRAVAKAAASSLDTEGYQVVNLHLARVEATEEATERAKILRELARRSRSAAMPTARSSRGWLRSARSRPPRTSSRWSGSRASPSAGTSCRSTGSPRSSICRAMPPPASSRGSRSAWREVGRAYQSADCFERVLLIEPRNDASFEALEVFYRSTNEWPVLIDLLGRRAVQVESDRQRAELFREMAQIYERELDDDAAALDSYQEADRLDKNHPDVVAGLARLAVRVSGISEDDALAALERSCDLVTDPKERARQLTRAGELAKLTSWDKAQTLFERARKDDPEYAPAVDGYVSLQRDRGQLADAITLLVNAAERIPSERARWLVDAGDFCVALGDTDWAKQLYRDARAADPGNQRAGAALVELAEDGYGDLSELVPILDELCRSTDDPARLRGYLLQRSKVAAQLGDQTGARVALSRAVDLDPEDFLPRRELADMLYAAQQWVKARPLYEGLLVDEDLLPKGVAPDLHLRVARSAKELGDLEAAAKHVGIALALVPDHREALLLHAELATEIRARSSPPRTSPRPRSAPTGSPRSAIATASSAIAPPRARCTARRSRTAPAITCCSRSSSSWSPRTATGRTASMSSAS